MKKITEIGKKNDEVVEVEEVKEEPKMGFIARNKGKIFIGLVTLATLIAGAVVVSVCGDSDDEATEDVGTEDILDGETVDVVD